MSVAEHRYSHSRGRIKLSHSNLGHGHFPACLKVALLRAPAQVVPLFFASTRCHSALLRTEGWRPIGHHTHSGTPRGVFAPSIDGIDQLAPGCNQLALPTQRATRPGCKRTFEPGVGLIGPSTAFCPAVCAAASRPVEHLAFPMLPTRLVYLIRTGDAHLVHHALLLHR